jgi:hypothetical protein
LLSVGSTGSDIADPSQIFGSSTSTGQYSGVSASQHDNSKRFKAAWTSFRNIALGLMVLAGLAIVISQALGSEIVDAYTVRKVLPRLLIAAIGISLSWILCQFFVKFSNELGYGIRSLIYQPFADLHPTLNLTGGGSGAASVAITLIGSEAIYSLGVFGLLSFAGTAALAVSIAVLILVLRQIVIIILIIASPIAIVAYILPNTQKIYKLWYESFSKSLLMFPIIAAFIAGGRVFSAVAINSDPHGPTGALYQFVGFVAYFAPYFLIPFAFKFAGGALGTLAGATHERGKGAFGKLSQFRGNQKKQRRADLASRAQSGNVFKHSGPDGFRAKANTRIQQGTNLNKLGYSPSRWKNNLRAAGAVEENEHVAKAAEHSNAFRTIMDSDDYVEAAMKGNYADAKAHLISKGYTNEDAETGASLVRQAQEDLGYDTLAVASAIANAGAGTSYIGGAGEMFDSIMKASHGNMAVAVPALAQARKRAEGAGRRDLLADGFAESIGAMQQIDSLTGVARTDKIKEVNKAAAKGAIEKQGIGAVLSGRGQSGANMVDALNARMQDAHANLANTIQGSPPQLKMKDGSFRKMTLDEAQRNFTQVMASTSAALDQSGAAAPEIQRLLADTIYNGKLETSTLSADIQKTLQTPVYNTKANGEIIKDINGIPQIDRYEMPTEITAGELMAKMESMKSLWQPAPKPNGSGRYAAARNTTTYWPAARRRSIIILTNCSACAKIQVLWQ